MSNDRLGGDANPGSITDADITDADAPGQAGFGVTAWRKFREWDRRRVHGGGVRLVAVAQTVGVVVVAAALANAYVLPTDQRNGALLPVLVETFGASVSPTSGDAASGGTATGGTANGGTASGGTANGGTATASAPSGVLSEVWKQSPVGSWNQAFGTLISNRTGAAPRTIVASTGVLLSAMDVRFAIPGELAGAVFRYGGALDFWAVVADPNPLYLRLILVREGAVETVGRYKISGGLLGAQIRVEFRNEIIIRANGVLVGREDRNDLIGFNGVAGLASLSDAGAGATFDDVILWADQSNVVNASTAVVSSAYAELAGLSQDQRDRFVAAFEGLSDEDRAALEALSPEQLEQLRRLGEK